MLQKNFFFHSKKICFCIPKKFLFPSEKISFSKTVAIRWEVSIDWAIDPKCMVLFLGDAVQCDLSDRARQPDIPKKFLFLFPKNFFFIPKRFVCIIPSHFLERGITFGRCWRAVWPERSCLATRRFKKIMFYSWKNSFSFQKDLFAQYLTISWRGGSLMESGALELCWSNFAQTSGCVLLRFSYLYEV